MSCSKAMIKDIIAVRPGQTVADVMDLLEKHRVRSVLLIEENGGLAGFFNFHHLLELLLPAPVTMDMSSSHYKHLNLRLDYFQDASPDLAQNLDRLMNMDVADLMVRDVPTVTPDTPMQEGIRLLVQHGSPVPVLAEGTRKVEGIVSSQGVIRYLQEIRRSAGNGRQ